MKKIFTTFVSLLLIAVATIGSAKAQEPQTSQTPKYTIKFASGTDDTAHWSFDPAAAHTTGVTAGTQVTLTYTGSLRVKSVTVSTVNPVETPLTFVAKTAGATVTLNANGTSAPAVNLEYSTDGGSNWITYSVGTGITLTNVGDMVQFRALSNATHKTLGDASNWAYNYFTLTGDCYAYGNVMSLLYNDFDEETTFPEGSNSNFFYLFSNCSTLYNHPSVELVLPATTLADYCYQHMFHGCTHLTTAPELPATTLVPNCYNSMFYACSGLTSAPELPATTLTTNCYQSMFSSCTALTAAPELPATTLANSCYNHMFNGCSALTAAPELPATTLADLCYNYMFNGCSDLTSAPELPATTLDTNCYRSMFQNCTTLTAAPALPATTLAMGCYSSMFSDCSGLTSAPVLPATTLAASCYSNMFQNCTTLTAAPALPATTLANSCYSYMFQNCTTLTAAPVLPATTLASSCYRQMFNGCTGLTTAPVLPATTLVSNCYRRMFYGCTGLNSVTCHATAGFGANNCLTDWVYGVALSGNFYCYSANGWPTNSTSGIPAGWNVHATLSTPLTFEAKNGTASVSIENSNLQYRTYSASTDTWSDWASYSSSTTTNTTMSATGDKVQFRAATQQGNLNYKSFTLTGNCYVYGNVMSLLFTASDFPTATSFPSGSPHAFDGLFQSCSTLYNHPSIDLVLPATTLVNYCYGSMFGECTNLTRAPELPATTLASSCYSYMFHGCTSLTTAPELPATTLVSSCYKQMFYGCTHLTTAPVLPATTLADQCYSQMFHGCTSLTTAPALPATTLASGCYADMFSGCTHLTTAPVLPATTLASNCYSSMFQNCTTLTAAPVLPATTLTSGCYSNMFQNCTTLTAAPVLPATTLVSSCYREMFRGCSSLNSITCKATDGFSASNCLKNWVNGVATGGNFYCYSANGWPSGNNGIPSGWTVHAAIATPLTFVANTAGATVAMVANNGDGSAPAVNLEYSTDGGSNWITYSVGTGIPLTNVGDMVQFRAKSNPTHTTLGDASNYAYNYFTISGGDCYAYGNVMSLLYNDFDEVTSFPEGSNSNFFYLFFNCATLYNHPSVELVLPATTLAPNCYRNMFYGCTHLTTAPELPATTLAEDCYYGMFYACSALTSAPELPATTLTTNCYQSMFSSCTALTAAPELPATTLANSCYNHMFNGCSALTAAPELPATTLADLCYNYMFNGCSDLTSAPELPATTLDTNCYRGMFQNCTTLTAAPALPATTLAMGCYRQMFQGCTSLNYIKCMATDISASNCLNNWVNGVATSGDFYCYPNGNWSSGTNGIPSGWTIHNLALSAPLTFEAKNGTASVSIGNGNLQYRTYSASTDTWSDWASYSSGTTDNTTMSATGDKVQFRAATQQGSLNSAWFTLTGNCYVYGNVMSLLYTASDFPTATSFEENSSYNLNSLFFYCTKLYNHPSIDLVLPATTLTEACYYGMFSDCSHLTKAPVLPATTLADQCYGSMFSSCTALTAAPALPATTLASSCYNSMFSGCTALTAAPELPATQLATNCYYGMFSSCTALTAAPDLPAETLAGGCYKNMFMDCSNLNYIKCLATSNINAIVDNIYYYTTANWLSGAGTSASGTKTFVRNSSTPVGSGDAGHYWPTGNNGIPEGWTVQTADN